LIQKTLLITIVFSSFAAFSQYEYRYSDVGNTRYMVSGGLGTGTSYWRSNIEHTELYNKNGTPIKIGNFKYKSKTALATYDLNVVFPVDKIMLGLGINFEHNIMDKIEIRSPQKDAGTLIYDQKFRLEKIYGIVEVPLQKKLFRNFIVNFQARIGYFGYSGVDREYFFGYMQLPAAYLIGVGAVANYKIVPHTFVFINPSMEYKYFRNNANEWPLKIRYNIFSFIGTAGIRIDISRY
jgi:hypothetical protein